MPFAICCMRIMSHTLQLVWSDAPMPTTGTYIRDRGPGEACHRTWHNPPWFSDSGKTMPTRGTGLANSSIRARCVSVGGTVCDGASKESPRDRGKRGPPLLSDCNTQNGVNLIRNDTLCDIAQCVKVRWAMYR